MEEQVSRPHSRSTQSGIKQTDKNLHRIQRPTTASKRRVAINSDDLHTFDDSIVRVTHCWPEPAFGPAKLDDHIRRIKTPTNAFNGGEPSCKRVDNWQVFSFDVRKKYGLPLVSGLERSSTVDVITKRVYTPTKSIPIYKHNSKY